MLLQRQELKSVKASLSFFAETEYACFFASAVKGEEVL